MRKIILTSIALLAASPAFAVDTVRIEREGYKMEYSVASQADGSTLITGTNLRSNEPFSLHVIGQKVDGDVAGRPVSFTVTKKQAAALQH